MSFRTKASERSLPAMCALVVCLLIPLRTAHAQQMSSQKRQLFPVWVRSEAVPFSAELKVPASKAWEVLPGVFEQLGYPGGASKRDKAVFVSRQMRVKGRLYEGDANSLYFNCGQSPGGGPAADEYEISFAIIAQVYESKSVGSGVAEVVIDGTARDLRQGSTSVFCTGTGRLEKTIIQLLEQRVAGH
jgi:hypothetical protein